VGLQQGRGCLCCRLGGSPKCWRPAQQLAEALQCQAMKLCAAGGGALAAAALLAVACSRLQAVPPSAARSSWAAAAGWCVVWKAAALMHACPSKFVDSLPQRPILLHSCTCCVRQLLDAAGWRRTLRLVKLHAIHVQCCAKSVIQAALHALLLLLPQASPVLLLIALSQPEIGSELAKDGAELRGVMHYPALDAAASMVLVLPSSSAGACAPLRAEAGRRRICTARPWVMAGALPPPWRTAAAGHCKRHCHK
jgi:hypothetical protein